MVYLVFMVLLLWLQVISCMCRSIKVNIHYSYQVTTFYECLPSDNSKQFIWHLRDLWICFSGNWFTPPLSYSIYISNNWYQNFWCLQERFQGPKLKIKMSYKREIPKLNRDNFSAWQGLMRLDVASIGDSRWKYLNRVGLKTICRSSNKVTVPLNYLKTSHKATPHRVIKSSNKVTPYSLFCKF